MRKRVLTPPGPRRRGVPLGNRNALKHGRFTRERRALNAEVRAYIKKTRALAAYLTALARAAKVLAALPKIATPSRDEHLRVSAPPRATPFFDRETAPGQEQVFSRGGAEPRRSLRGRGITEPDRTIMLLKRLPRNPGSAINYHDINGLS